AGIPMTATRTGQASIADEVLHLLDAAGVTYVFTCPGTTEVPLLAAAERRARPRLVLTTHESAAVAMADGYARATGEIGVVLLHANVGLCNGLATLYAAQVAHTPLLVLNGIKPTALHDRRAMTFTPESQRLAEPFCKSSVVAGSAESLVDDLARAIGVALQSPTGPVYVGLPQDHLNQASLGRTIGVSRAREPESAVAGQDIVSAARDWMTTASRPLLVAGPDVARRNLTDRVESLATALGMPIVDPPWRDLEWAATSSEHLHYAGVYRRDDPLMQASDLVVIVGAPPFLESEAGSGSGLPWGAQVIRIVDHPSWLDSGNDRELGVVGDVADTLERMHQAIANEPIDNSRRESHTKELRRRWEEPTSEGESSIEPNANGVHIQTALRMVAEHIDETATAVLDPVTASSALLDLLPRRKSSLFATGSGSLGWGMGAAVGVALAQPDRHVVSVVGDGVFQFGIQAICTAVQLELPVTWIVLNNNGYHAVRNAVARGRGVSASRSHPLADITGVDYAAIARGFGAHGAIVDTADALSRALAESGKAHVPTVIDLRLHGHTTNPPGS
ncbi:MAG: thiamine pyrophosphate-binding protein, partial [Haloechinothrix sp.]